MGIELDMHINTDINADIISDLLDAAGVIADDATPASAEAIASLLARIQGPLPATLLALWRITDGLDLPDLDARILGPAEIADIISPAGVWCDPGLLPLIDDRQSNYFALCYAEPLAFRIAYMPHDDGPWLVFRHVDSLLQAILRNADDPDCLDNIIPVDAGDFRPDARRTPDDLVAARALLRTDGERGQWNYAVQLLDASNLPELALLLETDHMVRRDALRHMRAMESDAVQALLAEDAQKFAAFVAAVTSAVGEAALVVTNFQNTVLQINGIWIELEYFYHRRHIPKALPRLIDWVRDLLAKRNPTARPGHFMTD